MKFIISFTFLALLSLPVFARPIHVYYEQNSTDAKWIKDIFVQTYHIPEDLIALTVTPKCEALKERGKLDLCLNNNGDLLIVSVDHEFISESLKIFQTP